MKKVIFLLGLAIMLVAWNNPVMADDKSPPGIEIGYSWDADIPVLDLTCNSVHLESPGAVNFIGKEVSHVDYCKTADLANDFYIYPICNTSTMLTPENKAEASTFDFADVAPLMNKMADPYRFVSPGDNTLIPEYNNSYVSH